MHDFKGRNIAGDLPDCGSKRLERAEQIKKIIKYSYGKTKHRRRQEEKDAFSQNRQKAGNQAGYA